MKKQILTGLALAAGMAMSGGAMAQYSCPLHDGIRDGVPDPMIQLDLKNGEASEYRALLLRDIDVLKHEMPKEEKQKKFKRMKPKVDLDFLTPLPLRAAYPYACIPLVKF